MVESLKYPRIRKNSNNSHTYETAYSSVNGADDLDFIVDSGASINITSTKSNHLLSNS